MTIFSKKNTQLINPIQYTVDFAFLMTSYYKDIDLYRYYILKLLYQFEGKRMNYLTEKKNSQHIGYHEFC